MIHTEQPSTSRISDFEFYNSYVSARKHITEAKAYSLKESNKYGAVIWLVFGQGESLIMLTKKRIRWKEIAYEIFGPYYTPYMLDEIKKHGLIIIK